MKKDTAEAAAASYGCPVLVIDTGDALGPADCLPGGLSHQRASENQLAARYRLTVEEIYDHQ